MVSSCGSVWGRIAPPPDGEFVGGGVGPLKTMTVTATGMVLARWRDDESAAGRMMVVTRWRDDKSSAGRTMVLARWRDNESAARRKAQGSPPACNH